MKNKNIKVLDLIHSNISKKKGNLEEAEVLIIAEELRSWLEEIGVKTSLSNYQENNSLNLKEVAEKNIIRQRLGPEAALNIMTSEKFRNSREFAKELFPSIDYEKAVEETKEMWRNEILKTRLYPLDVWENYLSAYIRSIPVIREYEMFLIKKFEPNIVFRTLRTAFYVKDDEVRKLCKKYGIKFTNTTFCPSFDDPPELDNPNVLSTLEYAKKHKRVAVLIDLYSGLSLYQGLKNNGLKPEMVMIAPGMFDM